MRLTFLKYEHTIVLIKEGEQYRARETWSAISETRGGIHEYPENFRWENIARKFWPVIPPLIIARCGFASSFLHSKFRSTFFVLGHLSKGTPTSELRRAFTRIWLFPFVNNVSSLSRNAKLSTSVYVYIFYASMTSPDFSLLTFYWIYRLCRIISASLFFLVFFTYLLTIEIWCEIFLFIFMLR